MKFLVNVDLVNNQLLNAKLQQLGADITASGNEGILFYRSDLHQARISNGTTIDTITNIIESVSGVGAISVGAVTAKSQAISIAAATGSVPGTMSAADFTKLAASTALNTASTIVLRDGSGNFAAGTITATLTGTASNATQLNSQAASFYLARTNHTGTQLAATISDFDTQVNTHTLNALAVPTGAVSMNSQAITNLQSPTNPTDAANKAYVDGVASGLDTKASVRATSTANVTVTYTATGGTSARGQITAAPNALDSVTLAAGNRILLKDQAAGAQNGIWVVTTLGTGANGVWDRATDFDQDAEVTGGAFTFVEEGTVYGDTGFVLTTNNPITIGGASGTALVWAQFSGGGTITASNGILKTGSNLTAVVDTTTTNPNSLSVSSNGLTIATTYAGQASITTLGTITTGTWTGSTIAVANGGTGATTAAAARTNLGATGVYNSGSLTAGSTSYTITHNLGTLNVVVMVVDNTGALVFPDITIATTNTVTLTFAVATAVAYRCIVIGG